MVPYNYFTFAGAFQEHGPWIRSLTNGDKFAIIAIRSNGVTICDLFLTWDVLLKDYVWDNLDSCGMIGKKYEPPTVTEIKADTNINLMQGSNHPSHNNPGHGGTPPGHGGDIPGHRGLNDNPFDDLI